jgi:hypothetical protein
MHGYFQAFLISILSLGRFNVYHGIVLVCIRSMTSSRRKLEWFLGTWVLLVYAVNEIFPQDNACGDAIPNLQQCELYARCMSRHRRESPSSCNYLKDLIYCRVSSIIPVLGTGTPLDPGKISAAISLTR